MLLKVIRMIKKIIFISLITIILFEFTCFVLVKINILKGDLPPYKYINKYVINFSDRHLKDSYYNKFFWVDINKHFGRWHCNNAKSIHIKQPDYIVIYTTNSYGARDKERTLKSNSRKRVVVLGDSFIEGYGVEMPERLTNILEKNSSVEHLNFGESGFGQTQCYLLYKYLAKKFDHSTVLIGILPENDFCDDNINCDYKDVYKPYWVGDYPNYKLVYRLDKLEKSAQYFNCKNINKDKYNYAYKDYIKIKKKDVYHTIQNLIFSFSFTSRFIGVVSKKQNYYIYFNLFKSEINTLKNRSKFYTYNKDELNRMEYSLKKIREEAIDKKIIVFTIPKLNDIKVYDKLHKSPLGEQLSIFCKQNEIEFIDLLPLMHDYTNNWDELYYKFDPHWTPKGHKVAAKLILYNIKNYP
jgi:hypothetical protein